MALAAMMLLVGGIGGPNARGQRFAPDPVEKLRRVLVDDFRAASQLLSSATAPIAARDMALQQYREKLSAAIHGNKTTGEPGLGNSSSVLSRALLLFEWNLTYVKRNSLTGVEAINAAFHEDLLAKFVKSVNQGLQSRQPAVQVALCNLISETLLSSGTQADIEFNATLGKTVDAIAALTRESDQSEVKVAAARALSRFYNRTGAASKAWGLLLKAEEPEMVRRAAAEALENMLVVTNGSERFEASQPGVSTRVGMSSTPNLFPEQKADMATNLLPIAGTAAGDASPRVRLAGVRALRECAILVREVLRTESTRVKDLVGKELTKTDLDFLRPTVEVLRSMNDAFKEFAQRREILLSELADTDPRIRTETRRALSMISEYYKAGAELERLLQEIDKDNKGLLQELREKGKEPSMDLDARTKPVRPEGGLRLIAGDELPPPGAEAVAAAPPAAAKEDKKPAAGPRGKTKFLNELDGLEQTLEALAKRLAELSPSESALSARRAGAAAIEALGDKGVPFASTLVHMLKDEDLIVRWIAARTLGKMGEKAALAVPSLIELTVDEDMDVQIAVATALGQIGPDAAAAVKPLTAMLTKDDAEVRLAAIDALEGIGLQSAPALPTLVTLFEYEDYRVRAAAASLVGRFLDQARPYVPQLRKLVDDRDSSVRGAASAAILAIGE
jgi:HEAT repeat protein